MQLLRSDEWWGLLVDGHVVDARSASVVVIADVEDQLGVVDADVGCKVGYCYALYNAEGQGIEGIQEGFH